MSVEKIFTGERFVPGVDDDEITIEHYQRYESILNLVKDKIVVDAACGEGYGSSIMGTVAKQVTGLDISPEAVARATENYATDKVKYQIGDISDLPLPDKSVEVFVSFETIEHVDKELQEKFIKEVARVLKEDGLFIISSPNKEIYSDLFNYDNEFHVHEMYKDEFVGLLKDSFTHVKLFNQYLEVACVIDHNDNQSTEATYKKNKDTYTSDGKYFIAVVSNHPVDDVEIQSVYLKHDVTYRKNIQRILSLQDEVESKNVHMQNLDKHIEELGGIIKYYSDKEKEYMDRENQLLKEKIGLLENERNLRGEIEKAKEETEKAKEETEKAKEEIEYFKEEIEVLKIEREVSEKSIHDKDVHIRNIEAERDIVRQERDALTNELHLIAYYRKHPLKRVYRVVRRLGGKVYRKLKSIVKKMLPYRVICKTLEIPTFSKVKVSIVIPVYNEFQYTYDCIQSIIQNVKDVPYEIIIGDDESTDDTKHIKKIVKNIKVNKNTTDHGFLMNCNRAAKLAKGDYIVFLNNDTVVKEEWLESLVELIESDEKIGMVGSKLLYPDGTLQEASGIIWSDATGWNYGRGQDPTLPEFNYVHECDYISGASIMIRKDLWNEIGGFDERYKPAYYEDSDLAFEVRKHGYKVMYQPKSEIIHFEGVSNGTDLTEGLKKYQVDNAVKFKEKWKDELEKQCEAGTDVFAAKERLGNKKVVLIVDHYVPTFDKDAGSRTVYQYIKIFLKKGYSVKFIGDNFAKMEPYTTILQQMGVEVYWGVWYMQNLFQYLKDNERFIDYIFLNRPHISVKYIDFMRENMHARIMFYGSDLHYMRVEREAELLNDDEKRKEAMRWKKTEQAFLKKVDVAYYLSPVEKEEIASFDPKIVVRNMKINIFDEFCENINENFKERKGILFVGGFAHAPNLDAVRWFIDEVYPFILEKEQIPFYIVGSNPPDELLEMAKRNKLIEMKGFVSDEELADLYANSKLAIVPLRYGAGIKGKVIEALYYGIPLITTSVGAEGIDEIENYAIIEDDRTSFAKAVIDIYNDTDKLLFMSRKSQEYVKENFSEDAAWKVIEQDFTN